MHHIDSQFSFTYYLAPTMNKYLRLSLMCFFISITQVSYAQDKKPKLALVLSGGGAKGLAHISILQILDSLGIVPDLVIGTSMGSIVGGLYALGYSGDSIAHIGTNADWDKLLSSDMPLLDVGVEEKGEFKRYLFDLDLADGKPKFGQALIKDQNIRKFLSKITIPSVNIDEFDDLSIPYRAVAADIVNGKEVILKDGSLYMAMRASMAIPSIFSPVEYQNTLLVDGAVLNNFPVDIAKQMGADFIIGSDVGGGMEPKENLDNIMTLLFQAGMLTSNLKNPSNRALCDILIDHLPNMTYSTGDFTKAEIIYEEGKIAAYKAMDKFVALADQLKDFQQRDHKLPPYKDRFSFDSIAYTGISEGNLGLVKSRTNIQTKTLYSINEVIDGVDRAMGTAMFDQIAFSSFKENEILGLHFEGIERTPSILKGSLHHDSEGGVGLLVNVTARNMLSKASRSLVTLDIAEEPKFRLQHQKYFGNQKTNYWWRSEAFGQQLNQKVYINGKKADDIRYRFIQFDNQVNRNLNSLNSYLGVGLNYEYTNAKPEVDPDINDNMISLSRYQFHHLEVNLQYVLNTMNDVFYPTQGTFIKAKLGRALIHHADIEFTQDTIPNADGPTNGFTRLGLSFEKRIPFRKKIIGIVRASTGFSLLDPIQSEEISFLDFGYGAKYFLGGVLERPRKDDHAFRGLRDAELIVTQFMMLNLGLQMNLIKSVYFTPHINLATVGYDDFTNYMNDAFSPSSNWSDENKTSGIISAGLTTSYKSFIGPVDLDVSWVNDINKFRIFLGIGYQFNRSN